MQNFMFHQPTKLFFGTDLEGNLPELLREAGATRVLIHFGGGSVYKNGIMQKVTSVLDGVKIPYILFGGAVPNPRVSLCIEGAALMKKEKADFILAVGGGSVIDSAKCMAAAVKNDKVWDFYMNHVEVLSAVPIGVVLTIPAAGSEMGCGTVITNEETGFKRATWGECLFPKFALSDPTYGYTLPDEQIANGVSDILAHMLERYFTGEPDVDFTDKLLEGAIRSVIENGPRAIDEKENYGVRAQIQIAGTFAHNGVLDVGRIGDWASHDIEHELSGRYDIAHGAGLSIIFPAWMKYVSKEKHGIFLRFAKNIMQDQSINGAIKKLETVYKSMKLPIRLSDVGIGQEHLRDMAEKAMVGRTHLGNLKKLNADDIYNILELAR